MPKITWKPLTEEALKACEALPLLQQEILFCSQSFSLLGNCNWNMANQAKTLVWDTVENNQTLLDHLNFISKNGFPFPKVRVADLGLLQYLISRFDPLEVELDLSQGNHNKQGIHAFEHRIPRLGRIILGPEWPLHHVKSIQNKVPIEYPAYGPLIIFHSPRQLVNDQNDWSGFAQAEEKHHDLNVRQNLHGTFLIYPKKLNVLDRLDVLDQAGVQFATITVQEAEEVQLIHNYLNGDKRALESLTQKYGPMSRAFSKSNRTDKQFKRLNSRRTQTHAPLGEVIEAKSKSHFVVMMNQATPQIVDLISPEGKRIQMETCSWQAIGSDQHFPRFYKSSHKRWICAGTKVWPTDAN